jgi:zinc transporter ZupT
MVLVNIGWTLILGFLTMMVADDIFASCLGGNNSHHGHSHGLDMEEDTSISHATTTSGGSTMMTTTKGVSTGVGSPQKDLEQNNRDVTQHHHERHEVASAQRRRNTVTLGLLIHNSMDGLAMGAAKAAMSSSAATQTVVFWAIMMHHVPASFGYATYLRNSGMEEHLVRRFIIIFSLAAPLSAAVTFFALHPDYFGFFAVSSRAVGTCLLFSAGTFLNVACVHALDEAKRGFPKWGLRQVLVLCLGAIVPGIASWNHEH